MSDEPATGSPAWQRLARAIKARRIEMGIETQKEAAERAGVAHNTWNRLENGQGARQETLEAVARALDWPPSRPSEILYGSGQEAVAPDSRFRRFAANALEATEGASPTDALIQAYVAAVNALGVGAAFHGGLDARFQKIEGVPEVVVLPIVVPLPAKVAARLTSEDVDAIQKSVRDRAVGLARVRNSRAKLSRMVHRLRQRGMTDDQIAEDLGIPPRLVADVLGDLRSSD